MTACSLARLVEPFATSTEPGASTRSPAPAGTSTAAKATAGPFSGMAPEPATDAARSSSQRPTAGLWTDALSAAPSPGTREAFLDLITGMARVLDFEQVSMSHDPVVVCECDALRDVLLDSIDGVRKAATDGS
jgi:hypothetical protein